jgi:hypothetical protein
LLENHLPASVHGLLSLQEVPAERVVAQDHDDPARGGEEEGRHPEPSAAIVDSQSIKTVEESTGCKGYDPH